MPQQAETRLLTVHSISAEGKVLKNAMAAELLLVVCIHDLQDVENLAVSAMKGVSGRRKRQPIRYMGFTGKRGRLEFY